MPVFLEKTTGVVFGLDVRNTVFTVCLFERFQFVDVDLKELAIATEKQSLFLKFRVLCQICLISVFISKKYFLNFSL